MIEKYLDAYQAKTGSIKPLLEEIGVFTYSKNKLKSFSKNLTRLPLLKRKLACLEIQDGRDRWIGDLISELEKLLDTYPRWESHVTVFNGLLGPQAKIVYSNKELSNKYQKIHSFFSEDSEPLSVRRIKETREEINEFCDATVKFAEALEEVKNLIQEYQKRIKAVKKELGVETLEKQQLYLKKELEASFTLDLNLVTGDILRVKTSLENYLDSLNSKIKKIKAEAEAVSIQMAEVKKEVLLAIQNYPAIAEIEDVIDLFNGLSDPTHDSDKRTDHILNTTREYKKIFEILTNRRNIYLIKQIHSDISDTFIRISSCQFLEKRRESAQKSWGFLVIKLQEIKSLDELPVRQSKSLCDEAITLRDSIKSFLSSDVASLINSINVEARKLFIYSQWDNFWRSISKELSSNNNLHANLNILDKVQKRFEEIKIENDLVFLRDDLIKKINGLNSEAIKLFPNNEDWKLFWTSMAIHNLSSLPIDLDKIANTLAQTEKRFLEINNENNKQIEHYRKLVTDKWARINSKYSRAIQSLKKSSNNDSINLLKIEDFFKHIDISRLEDLEQLDLQIWQIDKKLNDTFILSKVLQCLLLVIVIGCCVMYYIWSISSVWWLLLWIPFLVSICNQIGEQVALAADYVQKKTFNAICFDTSFVLKDILVIRCNKIFYNKVRVNDSVHVSKTLTYGGVLTIDNDINSCNFSDGDHFVLFQASTYKGSFTKIDLPKLNSNLCWKLDRLAVNGSIYIELKDPSVKLKKSKASLSENVKSLLCSICCACMILNYIRLGALNDDGSSIFVLYIISLMSAISMCWLHLKSTALFLWIHFILILIVVVKFAFVLPFSQFKLFFNW